MGMSWKNFIKDLGKSSWKSVSQGAVTGFATGILNAFSDRSNTLLPLDDMILTGSQELEDAEKDKLNKSAQKKDKQSYQFFNNNFEKMSTASDTYDEKGDSLSNNLRYVDNDKNTNNTQAQDQPKGRFNHVLYSKISSANDEDTWHIDHGNVDSFSKNKSDTNNQQSSQSNTSDTARTALHINLPTWGYDDFINERNMWTKSLQSPYSEPGYFYFKIFFDFNTLDGLLGGILNVSNTNYGRNSAAKYFDYCIASGRYGTDLIQSKKAALIKFVKTLSYININAPWFFQNISGLAEANSLVFNEINKQRKIEIGCLQDAIDMRLSTLLDLYKYAAFDDVKNREVIPENLRKFDINVLIYNIPVKRLHTPFMSGGDDPNNKRTYGYKRTNYINANPANPGETSISNNNDLFDHIMSFKLFSFQNCEIDISSLGAPYSREFSNKEPNQIDGIKLSINYDKCLTYTSNEFNQILFGSSGFLYNVYSDINVTGNDNSSAMPHQLNQRLVDLAEMQEKMTKTFRLDPTKDPNSFVEAAELIAHNNLFELSGMGLGNIYREDTKIGSSYYKNKLKYYNISSTFAKYFNSNNKSWFDDWFKKWHMDDNISDYAKTHGLDSGLSLVSQYITGAADINRTKDEQTRDMKAYMQGNKDVRNQYMTTKDKDGRTVDPRINTWNDTNNSNARNRRASTGISNYTKTKQASLWNAQKTPLSKEFMGIDKDNGTIIDPRPNSIWEDKNSNGVRDRGEFTGASSYLKAKQTNLWNAHKNPLSKEFMGIDKDNGTTVDTRPNTAWEDRNNNGIRDYGEFTGASSYFKEKQTNLWNAQKNPLSKEFMGIEKNNGTTVDPRPNSAWQDKNGNGVRDYGEFTGASNYLKAKQTNLWNAHKNPLSKEFMGISKDNGTTIDPRTHSIWEDKNGNGVRDYGEFTGSSSYWQSKAKKIWAVNKDGEQSKDSTHITGTADPKEIKTGTLSKEYLSINDKNGNTVDPRINASWNDANNNGIREINEISTSEYWANKARKIAKGNKEALSKEYLAGKDSEGNSIDPRVGSTWNDSNNNGIRDYGEINTSDYWVSKAHKIWDSKEHTYVSGRTSGTDMTLNISELGKLWEASEKLSNGFDKKSIADEKLNEITYSNNKLGSMADIDKKSDKKSNKTNRKKSNKNTKNSKKSISDSSKSVIRNWHARLGKIWKNINNNKYGTPDKKQIFFDDKSNVLSSNLDKTKLFINDNSIISYSAQLGSLWQKLEKEHKPLDKEYLTTKDKYGNTVDPRINSTWQDANENGIRDYGEMSSMSDYWTTKLSNMWNRKATSDEPLATATLTNYKKPTAYSIFNDANENGIKDPGELEFETTDNWNEKLKRIFNINFKG